MFDMDHDVVQITRAYCVRYRQHIRGAYRENKYTEHVEIDVLFHEGRKKFGPSADSNRSPLSPNE